MRAALKNCTRRDVVIARFWQRVAVKGEDDCWLWTGTTHATGYGLISCRFTGFSRNIIASRLSYELAYGECPGDRMVCHRCDNPLCVNPAHLFLGAAKDNNHDMARKGRGRGQSQTHCLHGHEFTPENTYWRAGRVAARQCRKCNAAAARRLKHRRAAA